MHSKLAGDFVLTPIQIYELQSELTEAKIKYIKVEEKLKNTESSLQSVQEQFKTKLQDFALKLKTSTSAQNFPKFF